MTQRFTQISNLDEARLYYEGLAGRMPERGQVIPHLCDQIGEWAQQNLGSQSAEFSIVELCAGGGQLADPLLQRFPAARYVGFDFLAHGIAYAQEKLARFDDRVTLIQADLNDDGWLDQLPPVVHIWTSLQSLHDLGDAAAVSRIYSMTYQPLADGGWWVLADLLADSLQAGQTDPGRLTVEEHLTRFEQAGYRSVLCTLKTPSFGCFRAEKSPAS